MKEKAQIQLILISVKMIDDRFVLWLGFCIQSTCNENKRSNKTAMDLFDDDHSNKIFFLYSCDDEMIHCSTMVGDFLGEVIKC
mmetsp:Transcript_16382/g.21675  ORF Transcript_16382/g.21675 Transcript_16382/m.21675 type:complete len:83 (+) Transcript_16382:709-957(+)